MNDGETVEGEGWNWHAVSWSKQLAESRGQMTVGRESKSLFRVSTLSLGCYLNDSAHVARTIQDGAFFPITIFPRLKVIKGGWER